MAIETRKEQMCALDWNIRPREGKGGKKKEIDLLRQFFASPDKLHTWQGWLRMILEDMFVLDAATVRPWKTRGGELYALEPFDGSTIKIVIDESGRPPEPPHAAYQQVLYGVPAVDFTRDELIYLPHNPRTHKVYGFGHVEQIINTVNIALRRQISQLDYFTEGTIPDLLLGVPENWTADQISRFQENWDALFTGDLARKRKAKFVPGGMKPEPLKPAPIKDEFDEWLARLVCFQFSLPPTPFIKQVNRSTAENASQTALEAGLGPTKVWAKGMMDIIIQHHLGQPDLEWVWGYGEQEQDPLTKSQIHAAYVGAGIMTKDEVREELGLKPLPKEQQTTNQPTEPGQNGNAKPDDSTNDDDPPAGKKEADQ